MARHAIERVLRILVVLFLVTFGTTFLLDLTPGNPAFTIFGENATADDVARVTKDLRLDDPFYVRYWSWLGDALHGDLGTSYVTNRDVASTVFGDLLVTLELVTLAMIIALLIAIPIGMYTAFKVNGVADRSWQVGSSVLISTPHFVSALLLVYLLALRFRSSLPIDFPVTGWVSPREDIWEHVLHLLLPSFTLALAEIPKYSRLLRAEMVNTLQEDYILAARARGTSTLRILFRHALRPSSFSMITVSALGFAGMISGAVIVETLFAIPGMGRLAASSVQSSDIVAIQGIVIVSAVMYVLINSSVDVLYRVIDPRVGSGEAG